MGNLKNSQQIRNVDNFQYHKEKREFEARKERRIEKRKKKIKVFSIFIIFVFLILVSPIFQLKTINVTELKKYTKSEVLEKMSISEGSNTFFLNSKKAESVFDNDPYIESCNIKKSFPNTINIEIKERKVRGYVPYMGSYLYIDEYGRVLDIQTSYTETLPIVKGLEFSEFKINEVLNVKNSKSFEVVVKIAQMMTKYEMLDLVVSIDVSDPENVRAYSGNIEVLLGNIKDCDKKIRVMEETLKKIPEGDRGTLDLSDLSKPIIFKYLT